MTSPTEDVFPLLSCCLIDYADGLLIGRKLPLFNLAMKEHQSELIRRLQL